MLINVLSLHILPCKTRETIYLWGNWWNFGESLSHVYQRWKAVVIPSGHYFSDIIYTSAVRYFRIKGSVFGVVAGSALIAAGASGSFHLFASALFPLITRSRTGHWVSMYLEFVADVVADSSGDFGPINHG